MFSLEPREGRKTWIFSKKCLVRPENVVGAKSAWSKSESWGRKTLKSWISGQSKHVQIPSRGKLQKFAKFSPQIRIFFNKSSFYPLKRRRSDFPPMRKNDPETKIRLHTDFRVNRTKFRYPNREKLDRDKVEIWFQTSCLTKVRFWNTARPTLPQYESSSIFRLTEKKLRPPVPRGRESFFVKKNDCGAGPHLVLKFYCVGRIAAGVDLKNEKCAKYHRLKLPESDQIARLPKICFQFFADHF